MSTQSSTEKFLTALAVIAAGVAISGATLALYRDTPFDKIVLGAFLFVVGFLLMSLVAAICIWGTALLFIGPQNREQLRRFWIYASAALLALFGVLQSYELYQLGAFSKFFEPDYMLVKLFLIGEPYLAAWLAISVLQEEPHNAETWQNRT